MDYDQIEQLRSRHPAWTLLSARNAPLVLSFLGRVFVEGNESNLPHSTLTNELDAQLYALNQRLTDKEGNRRFPRTARDYLDEWASSDKGWLRRFYPTNSDEPHYDLTPTVEKALAWVDDLQARTFIGTESRLTTIFELLRQMVHGAGADPAGRLADLHRRRASIEAEIELAEAGDLAVSDSVTQRDRYQQFARTARDLLADFRQVEENFRDLDRGLREQITLWEGSKGELLAELFSNRSNIAETDQGQSFRAFNDLLLSSERQAELSDLLARLHEIEVIPDLDQRLSRVHYDWIDASERTQGTVRRLSEQLRRFLDDQVWMENRRVFDLLHSIEVQAVRLRDSGDRAAAEDLVTMDIQGTSVTVGLPFERPLYRRTRTVDLDASPLEEGIGDVDHSSLFDRLHVDHEGLLRKVFEHLGHRESIELDEIVGTAPLEQGLAELIGYLSLERPGLRVDFDEDSRTQIEWLSECSAEADGRHADEPDSAPTANEFPDGPETDGLVARVADVPRVTYRREESP